MKNIGENKSSYHKLYLIDSDMFNRVLPQLNEVDKQELNDLNEKKRSFEDNQNDETFEQKNEDTEQKNEDTEQINDALDDDDAMMHPAPKGEEAKIYKPTILVVEKPMQKQINIARINESVDFKLFFLCMCISWPRYINVLYV